MLYHKKVYWDKQFDVDARKIMEKEEYTFSQHLLKNLRYSKAKRRQITEERLSQILYNIRDRKQNYYLYEVEVKNGNVVKAVVRTSYDKEDDISIVYRDKCIVTAWLNEKSDRHFTLDKKKYFQKPIDK
jgi:hypothetical protein